MSRIEGRGLSVTFAGQPAVEALIEVDLDVDDGAVWAVLGPSGCGKTTLLRVVAGLERPGAGTLEIGGRTFDGPGLHVAAEDRNIGLVPQEGALFPHLDVAGNVGFGLFRSSRRNRTRRVDEMLEMVGLEGLGRRRPEELSGGQQQRVALARALAPGPSAVLLDEPFSALDTSLRASIRDEVVSTLRAAGTTAVLVTHDQTEALQVADVVAVMRDGRIVQVAAPLDLYRRPADLWVARFVGDACVLDGVVGGDGTLDSPLGRLSRERWIAPGTTAVEGAVTVVVRPEQLRRLESSNHLALGATVEAISFLGADGTVSLRLDGSASSVSARWPSADLPTVGEQVGLAVTGEVLVYP